MATSDRLESNDPIKQQNLNQLHFVDNVSQTSLSQIVHKNYIQNQLDFGTLSIKILNYALLDKLEKNEPTFQTRNSYNETKQVNLTAIRCMKIGKTISKTNLTQVTSSLKNLKTLLIKIERFCD